MAEVDADDTHNPGFKYNKWELKGVPVRLELGKKDFTNEEVRMVLRFSGKKSQEKWETLSEKVQDTLDAVPDLIVELDSHVRIVGVNRRFGVMVAARIAALRGFIGVEDHGIARAGQRRDHAPVANT